MVTVRFKGLGLNVAVECVNGATVNDAIRAFEQQTGKSLKGMDFYEDGSKITNLESLAPSNILAVKSKHESA